MAVKARFYVAEVTRFASGNTGAARSGYASPAPYGRIVMRPVSRGEENKEWASATPSGEIQMTVNGPAMPWFESRIGSEIGITFED